MSQLSDNPAVHINIDIDLANGNIHVNADHPLNDNLENITPEIKVTRTEGGITAVIEFDTETVKSIEGSLTQLCSPSRMNEIKLYFNFHRHGTDSLDGSNA